MQDFDREYEFTTTDEAGKTETFTVSREERLKGERSFKIGGETFTHRVAVAPEVIHPWLEASDTADSEADWLKILDETVVAMLEPGQEDKWRKVRDPEAENPITQLDLSALMRWLIEVTTGRPTGQPSDSSSGSDGSGTSSTVVSSLPAPVAV